jgi:hypothetical protein
MDNVLNEVGWIQRVIVNQRTGNMIDGHLRVERALAQKEKSVPVCYVDLDEEKEKIALATFDPLGAMASSDQQMLNMLVNEIGSSDEEVALMAKHLAEDAGALPFVGDKPEDHWQGLPEFKNDESKSFRMLIIHFADQAAVNEFCRLTEIRLTEKSKYAHFPPKEFERGGGGQK